MTLEIRVSGPEKRVIEANAALEGLTVSEYLRREGMRKEPSGPAARKPSLAETAAPGDFAALVARYMKTMPRRNAEIVARKEMRRTA